MKDNIIRHLTQDPVLRPVVQRHPFPPEKEPGLVYHGLLASIISQQLSTKVADVIRGRFLALFEDEYPMPERLLSTEVVTLRRVGLSN